MEILVGRAAGDHGYQHDGRNDKREADVGGEDGLREFPCGDAHHGCGERLDEDDDSLGVGDAEVDYEGVATLGAVAVGILHVLDNLTSEISEEGEDAVGAHHVPYCGKGFAAGVGTVGDAVYRGEICRDDDVASESDEESDDDIADEELAFEVRGVEPEEHWRADEEEEEDLASEDEGDVSASEDADEGQDDVDKQSLAAADVGADDDAPGAVDAVGCDVEIVIYGVAAGSYAHSGDDEEREEKGAETFGHAHLTEMGHDEPILQQHLESHHREEVWQSYQSG